MEGKHRAARLGFRGDGLRVGGHLPTYDGLRFVTVNAKALGYNTVQLKLGDSEGTNPYLITDETADEYCRRMRGIDTYVHLPYNLNPCDPTPNRRGFYQATIRRYLKAASMLKARAVVLHPGFKKDLSKDEALTNAGRFLLDVIEEDCPKILVETDAGSKNGSAVGSLEFCLELLDWCDCAEVGLCIDTCHLWSRGYSLWDGWTREEFLRKYGDQVDLVHLNAPDPDVAFGSFRDRHNSPFEEFELDSKGLITDLTDRFPCILERRSIAVQRKDFEYIQRTTGWNGSEREGLDDGTQGLQAEDQGDRG